MTNVGADRGPQRASLAAAAAGALLIAAAISASLGAREWVFAGVVGAAGLALWRRAFLAEARTYLPWLRMEHVTSAPAGVRAQAVDPDGSLVDDFRFGGGDGILTLRNAPSPAATASLAIARYVVGQLDSSTHGPAPRGR